MSLLDLLAPQQDYIVLGGLKSPGLAIVNGAKLSREWATPAGYGLAGATTTLVSQKLIPFEVEIQLWEPDHFFAWDAWIAAVLGEPRGASLAAISQKLAMSIQHPILNRPPFRIT